MQVINGATRTVTKGLNNNLGAVLGKHSVDSLHKTAVLGNITRNMGGAAVRNLSRERWGVAVLSVEEQGRAGLWQETTAMS